MNENQNTPGYVTLDYVVKTVLMDLDDNSMTKYMKFLQYAINGWFKLNLDTMDTVKIAYLEMNSNFTANLPDDFVTYCKIGVIHNGVFIPLGFNPDLIIPRRTDDCGIPINENSTDCSSTDIIERHPGFAFYLSPHYRGGQWVGEMYGETGGKAPAQYRIDWERRQVAFDSGIGEREIVIEYKSTGIDVDGKTIVPRKVVEALTAYIHWKRVEHKDKESLAVKDRKHRLFAIEHERLRDLELAFTAEEFLDMTYSTYKLTPKR